MKTENIIRGLIGVAILLPGIWLLSNEWASLFQKSILLLSLILTALWILSLVIKDAGIIDIFWGTGFVIVSWLYAFQGGLENLGLRHFILLAMITLWGLRLSIYLAIRNIGKPEDYRYAAWRKENGKNWWWKSLLKVFLLQGVLLWVISATYLPALKSGSSLLIWDYVGIAFWSVGFFFEAVGDWQMMCFKSYPINKGKVMDQGVWRYTRHPNYFGEAMMWWGFFLFSLAHPQGVYYIFCPVIMTFLLLKVSGVAMLEEGLKASKPDYQDYMRKTSAFIPMPPKE